jgi:hypothetical protein
MPRRGDFFEEIEDFKDLPAILRFDSLDLPPASAPRLQLHPQGCFQGQAYGGITVHRGVFPEKKQLPPPHA